VPFTKVDEEERMVFGRATDETPDEQGQVVDYEATKVAVAGWSKWRNVREMHRPQAAGVAETITLDDAAKSLDIGVHVVDDQAWEKVKAGVYKGFSIGGKALDVVMEKATEGQMALERVTRYVLSEISLVDRPANPSAVFSLVKREVSEAEKERAEEEYGDVEFADTMNKKYPIDTEAHIRAAWNYISKPKNAALYKADEVKAIKGRIVRAWKKKIDEEGPPSATEKGADVETLRKLVGEEMAKGLPDLEGLAKVAQVEKVADGLQALADEVEDLAKMADVSKIADNLQKMIGDLAQVVEAFEKMDERLEVVEKTPAGTGPILREIGALGPVGLDDQSEGVLKSLMEQATDPGMRELIGQQLAEMQIKAAQQRGQVIAMPSGQAGE